MPPGMVDGDGEVGGVVGAHAEVVFADLAGGGELRDADLVGAVDAVGACAGLLDSGIDGEGRAAADGGDAEQFPTLGDAAADGLQELGFLDLQVLRGAEGETVGDVEGGWAFLGVGVGGVLRERDRNRSGGVAVGVESAGIVERFGIGIACLDGGAVLDDGALERSLQGVVAGVGGSLDDLFGAEAADGVAVGAEEGVAGKAGAGSGVGIGKVGAREAYGCGSDVGGVGGQLAEGALEAEGPGLEIAIAEAAVDAGEVQRSELRSG